MSFFAGNDLLASTAQPPPTEPEESLSVDAKVSENDGETDRWIQLKCTQVDWTVSEILNGNLLRNFIINALLSDSSGRKWKAELVTTAKIRTLALKEFISDPKSHPENYKKLSKIIDETKQHLQENASGEQVPELDEISKVSLRVLEQFTHCSTIHRDVLVSDIRAALTERLVDAPLVKKTFEQLYGTMQHDAVNQNAKPCHYDRRWLTDQSGHDFNDTGLLEKSVTEACDEQVQLNFPKNFNSDRVVNRSTLTDLLGEFHSSSSTLFILSGRSGVGKSSLLADWCNKLQGKPRLLIRAQNLMLDSTLASLVAVELRKHTTQNLEPHIILQKFSRHNTSITGVPVVVLDDIRPSVEDPGEFSKMLGNIATAAKSEKIKLIISLQSDFEKNLSPFKHVDPELLFSSSGSIGRKGDSSDIQPVDLGDYSDDELLEVLRMHTGDNAENLFLQIKDQVFSPLRNPRSLEDVLDSIPDESISASSFFKSLDLVKIIDHPITLIKEQVTQGSGNTPEEVNEIIDGVLKVLWENHGHQVSKVQLRRVVESELGSITSDVLPRLYECGLLDSLLPEHFADRRIWARCIARYVHSLNLSTGQIASKLNWQSDKDIIEQLVATSDDPITFSEALINQGKEWIPGICHGLVYSEPSDVRVLSLLTCLALSSADVRLTAGALGKFAIRSKIGKKWLLRQFVSVSESYRRVAETALYEIAKFASKDVCRFVEFRFRLTHQRLEHHDKNWRKTIARGIRPLGPIESMQGAKQAYHVLSKVRDLAEQSLGNGLQQDVKTARTDSLLNEFDELKLYFAMVLQTEEYKKFLESMQSDDLLYRARSINSIRLLTHLPNQDIDDWVLERLAHETEPGLLARVLWVSFQVLSDTPEPALVALEGQSDTLWKTYESAAAALSTLEILGRQFPDRVSSILPIDWPADEFLMFSVSSELYVMCWIQCFRRTNETIDFKTKDCPALTWTGQELLELYSLRSQLTALLLGLSDFGRCLENPSVSRYELRKHGQDFFHLNLSSWVIQCENKSPFLKHQNEIEDVIIRSINSEFNNQPSVLDQWNQSIRFYISRDCIDVLVELLHLQEKITEVVKRLPTDWQRLYCLRQLLARNYHQEDLIDLALQECEDHRDSATGNASSERGLCLIELQKIAPDRVPPIQQDGHGLAQIFMGGENGGARFVSSIEENLEQFLPNLEKGVNTLSDFMLLKNWNIESQRWQTSLIAQVYSRMFEHRNITPCDAESLLIQMLTGLKGLPESKIRDEHLMLYQQILDRLRGNKETKSQIRNETGPIVESHKLAELILDPGNRSWKWDDFLPFLQDRRGWYECHDHRWNELGEITGGWGQSFYVLFFFPAVRLAMLAVNGFKDSIDAGFMWTTRRREAELVTKEFSGGNATRYVDSQLPMQRLADACRELPEQESVHSALGVILLANGQSQDAEASINHALELPTCTGKSRGSAFYNLACCEARNGNHRQCKTHLLDAESLGSLDKVWMKVDSDLKSVRELEWFQQIADR